MIWLSLYAYGSREIKRILNSRYLILLLNIVHPILEFLVRLHVIRLVETSDVDFLIDVGEGQTLLDLIGLQQDLEMLIKCSLDVAQSTVLHPRIRERVLSEAISV